MKAAKTISVVLASSGGFVKKAYASENGAVIIDLYNSLSLREEFTVVTVATCEVVTKAPRVRKSRARVEQS